MKKNIFKTTFRFFKKLKYRYEEWKAGMEHFPVDLGSKK